jgi:hypothetical protein|tara:strand:- start:232 stop:489 length:258 start_codon:yes stop_codon:yes gene_type:complete
MRNELFSRLKQYLKSYVDEINAHTIGDKRVEELQVMIDEIELFLRTDSVEQVEQDIQKAERIQISEDLADEILNSKHCIGGNCED